MLQAELTPQYFVKAFSELPLNDLESILKELNSIVVKKRVNDQNKRDQYLLRKINESVMSETDLNRYIYLQEKMEVENLPEEQYQELLALVAVEEKLRNKRYQYLYELSLLREVKLNELLIQLGLTPLAYG